jgi:hypothetical protein
MNDQAETCTEPVSGEHDFPAGGQWLSPVQALKLPTTTSRLISPRLKACRKAS